MSSAEFRIWHPAFDAYHCSFRILRILRHTRKKRLPIELLYILDFYLLCPALLHNSSMTEDVRAAFRELHITRAKDDFVQYPSAKSLFRDIAIFQRTAVSDLVAKAIIDRDRFLSGEAQLRETIVPKELLDEIDAQNASDKEFMDFLVEKFGSIELFGARGLRALTGLVRRQ